jgi:hypothetical protein
LLDVRAGEVKIFEAYRSEVRVSGGKTGVITAYDGANIQYSGGDNHQLLVRAGGSATFGGGTLDIGYLYDGGKLKVGGGLVEQLNCYTGSKLMINGGEVDRVMVSSGSTVQLTGGLISPSLLLNGGAHAVIAGGRVGTGEYAIVGAGSGADVNVIGTTFLRNGQPIQGLNQAGNSIVFSDRLGDVLDVILADGTPLRFVVDDVSSLPQQPPTGPQWAAFSSSATLRLTLVPEPSTLACAATALAFCAASQKRPKRRKRLLASRD